MMLAQINLADLCFLLTFFLAGPIAGLVLAREFKAGTPLTILLALGGLLAGYLLGRWANKAAYAVLMSKKLSYGLKFLLYPLMPVLTLLFLAFLPFMLRALILHLR
jgi:uncharacterized membrane protein YeaQ/YmgE (transglycosylase-associated protein family)